MRGKEKLLLFKMTKLNLKDFVQIYILKNDNMRESDLQRVYNYLIYHRDFDRGIVNIDKGSLCGAHWIYFIIKDNISYYFVSFGGQSDSFLLHSLPKPILYHEYEIKDLNSRIFVSYCSYFFNSIERMNYYDTFFETHFGYLIMLINIFGNSSSFT